MKVRRVRIYEDDWQYIDKNFGGTNQAEKIHRMVENLQKVLRMLEMYKELADMYRQKTNELSTILIQQQKEVLALKSILESYCEKKTNNENKGFIKKLKKKLNGDKNESSS